MGMPRMNTPEAIHFVTNRCEHEMFFLLPKGDTNNLIKFWMAKAIHKKAPDIEIYAFCFLSNHFHMLLRDPKGQLAAFMNYFQGHLATAINKQLKRRGKFWHREYDDVLVDGDSEFWDRYAYTTLNAVSSNLVEKAHQWKGVSSYHYALKHKPVIGQGLNNTTHNNATRFGRKVDKSEHEETFKFTLTVPPQLQGLTPKAQTDYLQERLDTFTVRYRNKHRNKPALGMLNVLRQHPLDSSTNPKRSPRFNFLSFSPERRQELKENYRDFLHEYKKCIHIWQMRLDKGVKSLKPGDELFWPAGCYPPTSHQTIAA